MALAMSVASLVAEAAIPTLKPSRASEVFLSNSLRTMRATVFLSPTVILWSFSTLPITVAVSFSIAPSIVAVTASQHLSAFFDTWSDRREVRA